MNSSSTWKLFIEVCLLSSVVLVLLFKYDLRFDKTINPNYYRQFPFISKTISIIKLTVKYFALGYFLTFALVLIWNFFASLLGWPLLPALTFSDFWWVNSKNLGWFWNFGSGMVFLLALNDIRRCWRHPGLGSPKEIAQVIRSKQICPEDILTEVQVASIGEHRSSSSRQSHLKNSESPQPIWDVFISYKTKNVDIARLVADQLTAAGIKVWFAEYYVLLQNYEEFQDAIDYGLNNCDRGIVFTNEGYFESEYCQMELKGLLKRHRPEKILNIMIPKIEHSQCYKDLENSPSYHGTGDNDGYDDKEGILSFIHTHTGWPLALPITPVSKAVHILYETFFLGKPVSLNVTDWELTQMEKVEPNGTLHGLEFRYRQNRHRYRLFVNLVCDKELSREGQRQDQTRDDRQMYKYLRKFAPRHIGRVKARVCGLHLLFHEELSQMALTYWVERGSYWTRKYSIIIPNKRSKEMAEFIFTFGFQGSFSDYYRTTYVMDHFVKSLQWN